MIEEGRGVVARIAPAPGRAGTRRARLPRARLPRACSPRARSPRARSARPWTGAAPVAVALVVAVAGVALLGLMLRERGQAAGVATVGRLTLQVHGAVWTNLDHGHQDGFQRPAQMTPGAPAPGQRRLAVDVAVLNRGGGAEPVGAAEFGLQAPDGSVVPLAADNLGDQRLGPGLGVNASLTFDLPDAVATQAAPNLVLVWRHAGKVARLPLTVGGDHPHA
jgi:hypothetical protein